MVQLVDEKGLLLLGRASAAGALPRSNCFLVYRRPVQEALSADLALRLVSRLGFTPAPDYDYPQKGNLERFQASIAPRIGSTVDSLVQPFMATDSGELYRRVGEALKGPSASPAAAELAADQLFRGVFPNG